MDPVSGYAAFSPGDDGARALETEANDEDRRLSEASERATTQQLSADPALFMGEATRGVVVARGAASHGHGDGLRLALDLGRAAGGAVSMSQLSQFGGYSQPQSQFNELFGSETQPEVIGNDGGDERQESAQESKQLREEDMGQQHPDVLMDKPETGRKSSGGGAVGFLSRLEDEWIGRQSGNASIVRGADDGGGGIAAMGKHVEEKSKNVNMATEVKASMATIDLTSEQEPDFVSNVTAVEVNMSVPTTDQPLERVSGAAEKKNVTSNPDVESMGDQDEVLTLPLHEDSDDISFADDASTRSFPETESLPASDRASDTEADDIDSGDDIEKDVNASCRTTDNGGETVIDAQEKMDCEKMKDLGGDAMKSPTPTPKAKKLLRKADTRQQCTPPRHHDPSPRPSAEKKFLVRTPKSKETGPRDLSVFAHPEDEDMIEDRKKHKQAWSSTKTKKSRRPSPQRAQKSRYKDNCDNSTDDISDDEDVPTTQSSTDSNSGKRERSPPQLNHTALKKRAKGSHQSDQTLLVADEKSYEFLDSACQCGEVVCQCGHPPAPYKQSSAMRNLEFSFAIPQSQDTESQVLESRPDVGAIASVALNAARQANEVTHSGTRESCDDESKPKRQNESTLKNSRKNRSVQTPNVRKRGRSFMSPDVGIKEASVIEVASTPRKSTRITKQQSTQSSAELLSTPSLRTRGKFLSPALAFTTPNGPRSKLFKNKFVFCVSGFAEGETSLINLIEELGGRVYETDILKKGNPKAIVITTPVSWRKMKFMYAVACGIPVVHPEWIHACATAMQIVPLDGYRLPSGYALTTGKFECLPPKPLSIFAGLTFGIPLDVPPSNAANVNSMREIISFILLACGADRVDLDLTASSEALVDIVLSDVTTGVCDLYARKHGVPVKNFAWVTECMMLQSLIDPKSNDFRPQNRANTSKRFETALSVTARIGNGDSSPLKLHIGELVLVDFSDHGLIDHFLLFDVCEILSIRVNHRSRNKNEDSSPITLEVGVLKRAPNSPALIRKHTRTVDLSPSKVKRRVVAVSKTDFEAMAYRDESIFYYEV